MTNGELIKILQRFPPEGPVQVKRHGEGKAEDVNRAEMAVNPAPLPLQEQNVGWADLLKDRVGVVLVYGEPKVGVAPSGNRT